MRLVVCSLKFEVSQKKIIRVRTTCSGAAGPQTRGKVETQSNRVYEIMTGAPHRVQPRNIVCAHLIIQFQVYIISTIRTRTAALLRCSDVLNLTRKLITF